MTTTTTKQHAGNNATLARIKKTFNGKIYRIALEKMNAEGAESVRAFIREYFNEESRHHADEIIDGTEG